MTETLQYVATESSTVQRGIVDIFSKATAVNAYKTRAGELGPLGQFGQLRGFKCDPAFSGNGRRMHRQSLKSSSNAFPIPSAIADSFASWRCFLQLFSPRLMCKSEMVNTLQLHPGLLRRCVARRKRLSVWSQRLNLFLP